MSQLTFDLEGTRPRVDLSDGAAVLRGFASARAPELLASIDDIATDAAFRHLVTPGGKTMSVAMTNCGALGWTSSAAGYRYSACDPESGRASPPMPSVFASLAADAALEPG